MTITRHFTAMQDVPFNQKGMTPWQVEFLRGAKQNLDLLTGANAESHMAVVRGDVTVEEVQDQGITGTFDATDHTLVARQLLLVTDALNRLISDIN
jgi:hypothetical protein